MCCLPATWLEISRTMTQTKGHGATFKVNGMCGLDPRSSFSEHYGRYRLIERKFDVARLHFEQALAVFERNNSADRFVGVKYLAMMAAIEQSRNELVDETLARFGRWLNSIELFAVKTFAEAYHAEDRNRLVHSTILYKDPLKDDILGDLTRHYVAVVFNKHVA